MTCIVLFTTAVILFSSMIAFITLHESRTDAPRIVLGTTSVLCLVLYYTSPMVYISLTKSTFYEILRTKNTSSLDPMLSIASVFNSVFWTIYGFVISDAFVYGPNAFGLLFSILQGVVLWVYPRIEDAQSVALIDDSSSEVEG